MDGEWSEYRGCRYKVRMLMREEGTQGWGFYIEGSDGNRPVVVAYYDVKDLAANSTLAAYRALSAIDAWADAKRVDAKRRES